MGGLFKVRIILSQIRTPVDFIHFDYVVVSNKSEYNSEYESQKDPRANLVGNNEVDHFKNSQICNIEVYRYFPCINLVLQNELLFSLKCES